MLVAPQELVRDGRSDRLEQPAGPRRASPGAVTGAPGRTGGGGPGGAAPHPLRRGLVVGRGGLRGAGRGHSGDAQDPRGSLAPVAAGDPSSAPSAPHAPAAGRGGGGEGRREGAGRDNRCTALGSLRAASPAAPGASYRRRRLLLPRQALAIAARPSVESTGGAAEPNGRSHRTALLAQGGRRQSTTRGHAAGAGRMGMGGSARSQLLLLPPPAPGSRYQHHPLPTPPALRMAPRSPSARPRRAGVVGARAHWAPERHQRGPHWPGALSLVALSQWERAARRGCGGRRRGGPGEVGCGGGGRGGLGLAAMRSPSGERRESRLGYRWVRCRDELLTSKWTLRDADLTLTEERQCSVPSLALSLFPGDCRPPHAYSAPMRGRLRNSQNFSQQSLFTSIKP